MSRAFLRSAALLALCAAAGLAQTARLADIVNVDGVEDNFLSGVGIVVGLDGTGDGDGAARQMIANLVRRRGINISPAEVQAENVAIVSVQAVLPPFKRKGDRIDVNVSSIGKAKSLFGGRLLEMQLTGPDPNVVYAIAAGPVNAGVSASGASGSKEKLNHPTSGRVVDGAKVEKEVPQRLLTRDGTLRLKLRQASYATAANLAAAVNGLAPGLARAVDGQTVDVRVPAQRRHEPVMLLDELGRLEVKVDPPARIVIDSATGTIVIGGSVTILPGVVAHGSLAVSIQETPQTSQPNPLAEGTTVVTPQSQVRIEQRGTELRPLPGATSAAEVAKALNTLGLTPRDLIVVFQNLKANGLVHAELVIQ
ncbi:MAG TPA: flagellar basal body P-ring protein FlgI [Planctomycetota bacterium]|nr:flagellar basal body P-ring protein FlgI [Planctomycetota bacterium]